MPIEQDQEALAHAAELLGLEVESLVHEMKTRTSYVRKDTVVKDLTKAEAEDTRNAMAKLVRMLLVLLVLLMLLLVVVLVVLVVVVVVVLLLLPLRLLPLRLPLPAAQRLPYAYGKR